MAKGEAPAYQVYAADALADERLQLMTLEQEGAFSRLRDLAWVGKSIPADPGQLSRLCKGIDPAELVPVIAMFEPSENGRLRYPSHEAQRARHEEYRAKQAKNGARGGRPAKQKPEQSQPKGLGLFGETQSKAKKRSHAHALAHTHAEEQKQKTSRAKAAGDPRHSAFRALIATYWKHTNTELPNMPWGPAEAKQLKNLLSANPDLDETACKALLNARSKSEVNFSDRPCKWLATLTDFGNGPLNQYGKPRGLGVRDGKRSGNTDPNANREIAGHDAIEAAIRNCTEGSGTAEERSLRVHVNVADRKPSLNAFAPVVEIGGAVRPQLVSGGVR